MDWPLSTNNFSFWDKIKISKFILTNDRWTQGEKVKEYEKLWEDYIGNGTKAVMVASGSAANELIALRQKNKLDESGFLGKRKVIFPANTWISSISPWINFGFEPVFVDIEPDSFCLDSEKTIEVLKANPDIIGVFYTTLLGNYGENILKLKAFCDANNHFFKLDNCESSFSKIINIPLSGITESSTSFYLSHLTSTGSEGGMIFAESQSDYEWYLMARSHGMVRVLSSYGINTEKYQNPQVDSRFDFNFLGSNYRSSDFAAFPAILDWKKVAKNNEHRINLYNLFLKERKTSNFVLQNGAIPFALPIQSHDAIAVKNVCAQLNIETRPVVGGNLLRQTAFKKYGKPEDFPVAEEVHKNWIYVGLHEKVTPEMIKTLANFLNY